MFIDHKWNDQSKNECTDFCLTNFSGFLKNFHLEGNCYKYC